MAVFTYAEAESVLARLYDAAGAAQRGTFRTRLKTLKKVGVPLGSHPGRGKKIRYDYDELFQWAFCLELAQLGVDPAVVGRLMAEQWRHHFRLYFQQAEMGLDFLSDGPKDFYVMIHTDLMSASWHRRGDVFSERFPGLIDITPFDLNGDDASVTLCKLKGDRRRAFILNISESVRLLVQALRELGMADRLPDHLNPDIAVEQAMARATQPHAA